MALIRMDGLEKIYNKGKDNEVAALKNISIEINSGEFVAIMGPSGSGKSTLMHLMGFLDRPTNGKYFFGNVDSTSLTDNALADIRNNKVGFVFQSFNLLPRTTAIDNVILPMLYSRKYSRAEMQARAKGFLANVGLEERMSHMPSELSGGQQQRVAIARAMVNDPAVIFADEPTGNLDTKSSQEIMHIFKNLNEAGRTLVFVTHEEDIAKYAKRIIKLKDGEILSDSGKPHSDSKNK